MPPIEFDDPDHPLEDWESSDEDDWYDDDDDSSNTAPCPNCGTEIFADSEWCPACGEYIDMSVSSKKPSHWVIAIVALTIVALLSTLFFW